MLCQYNLLKGFLPSQERAFKYALLSTMLQLPGVHCFVIRNKVRAEAAEWLIRTKDAKAF